MGESKLTNLTTPWDLGGQGKIKDDRVIEQDAARGTADMEFLTVMVRDTTTEKLKPMITLTDTATESLPVGLLMQTVAAADIVAGDVSDVKLLVGSDKMIDEDMIVLENSLTLESLITVPTGGQKTIRTALQEIGIYPRKSQNDQQIQPIA
jgi:hypothetical protein